MESGWQGLLISLQKLKQSDILLEISKRPPTPPFHLSGWTQLQAWGWGSVLALACKKCFVTWR